MSEYRELFQAHLKVRRNAISDIQIFAGIIGMCVGILIPLTAILIHQVFNGGTVCIKGLIG
jgi:hypothetical protein